MSKFLLHTYGEFDRAHPIPLVSWPHFDLFFVHSGRMKLRVMERDELKLRAGEGVLLYPHTLFSGRVRGGRRVRASVQHFVLEKTDGDPVLRFWAGRHGGFAALNGDAARGAGRDVVRALQLAAQSPGEIATSLRRAQLVLQLGRFMQGVCAQAPGDGRASRGTAGEPLFEVMRWARERHGAVRVDELARRSGYSPGHFRLLFEEAFRERPAAFLLRLRINEAKRLLGESRRTPKEIAEAVGYGDVVAFHRAFASAVGRTPGDFRKRYAPVG